MFVWSRIMLSSTTAVMVNNRYVSEENVWWAGVRQGCPLSLYTYMFIREALTCWILDNPDVDLTIPGACFVCHQYADDTQVFVSYSLEQHLQSLRQCMQVFRDTTGRSINGPKSALLHIDGSYCLGRCPGRGLSQSFRNHLCQRVTKTGMANSSKQHSDPQ